MIFLKNIHGNMMFSLHSTKMVFVFPTGMILHFFQKSKDDLFPKISGIIEKYDIHPRKCGISSDRKIKDDKKVYLVKYA